MVAVNSGQIHAEQKTKTYHRLHFPDAPCLSCMVVAVGVVAVGVTAVGMAAVVVAAVA